MSPSFNDRDRPPHRGFARPWVAALVTFALTMGVAAPVLLQAPVIFDTDSYFHLAVGRLYAERGWVDSFPWARFSAMADGFGDKEFLFHVFLAPFTDGTSTAGGRLALALLVAAAAAAMAAIAVRVAGAIGLLAPWIVLCGAQTCLLRVVRLRPELFALTLFLVAAALVGGRRYRWLGFVALVFSLSYTAFHAFLGLCGLWFLYRGLVRGRWDLHLVLYPLLGVLLGLLIHPHFPHNLVIWKIQSIDFFRLKDTLDVGNEIGPPSGDILLLRNLGLWVAMAVLVLAARVRGMAVEPEDHRDPALTDALAVGALVFAGLYLLMARFAIYAAPFALLWAFAFAGPRARRLRLPFARPFAFEVKTAVVLALVAAVSVGAAVPFLRARLFARGPVDRESEWAAFGRAIPPAARVAATWGSGQLYFFWAPQALYLNVLDPVFMAVASPEAHEAQRAVFAGEEPDVPRSLVERLDSDHLASSFLSMAPRLVRRLAADPRVVMRFGGLTRLFAVLPDQNHGFVLDWRQVPESRQGPVVLDSWSETTLDRWPVYPRAEAAATRAVEGFVEASTLPGSGRCRTLARRFLRDTDGRRVFELAPWGPTRWWLDDRLIVAIGGEPAAVLGQGAVAELVLEAGAHTMTVETCAGTGERFGFYLLARDI